MAEIHEPDGTKKAGGSDAFRAIYEAELAYVWRSLRRLGVQERDLEDLAHDVFVIFYRTMDRYDPTRPIRPWLFGIAFRVASDYRRRAGFRREVVGEERERVDTAPLPVEAALARERREVVIRALDTLDMDQRAVFVMHELEGHSIPEIAATLTVSHNTLYSRLRLARKRFATAARRILGQQSRTS